METYAEPQNGIISQDLNHQKRRRESDAERLHASAKSSNSLPTKRRTAEPKGVAKDLVGPAQLFVPWRADPLCWLCRCVIRPLQAGEAITPRSYLELKISAARGCPLCQFLYQTVGLRSKTVLTSGPLLVTRNRDTISIIDFSSVSVCFEVVTATGPYDVQH